MVCLLAPSFHQMICCKMTIYKTSLYLTNGTTNLHEKLNLNSAVPKSLGETIVKDISLDIDEMSSSYKDMLLKIKTWLEKRNPVLVAYLKGTCYKNSNADLEKERCLNLWNQFCI